MIKKTFYVVRFPVESFKHL